MVYDLAVMPDGVHVVSCGSGGSVRLWNMSTGDEVASHRAHQKSVRVVAVTADGRYVISGDSSSSGATQDLGLERAAPS